MKSPAWGTKRICQACTARYYDLNRTPILCPKCQVRFDPTAGLKLRSDSTYKASGGRAKSIFGKSTPLGFVEPDAETAQNAEAGDDDEEKVESDQDDDSVEDVSELGDDSDDLAEIVETDPNEER